MVKPISHEEIISKASKGYIKDYYTTDTPAGGPKSSKGLLRPEQEFNDLLNLMKDSTFNTEVNVLIDGIMKEGYKIIKKDDISKRDAKKERLFNEKYRGYQLLRSIFLNLMVYRNSFIEIEYKGRVPENLHLLETTEMNINITPHGEVLGYTQIHESGPVNIITGKRENSFSIFFEPEECIHISPSRITTNPWGYVDTRSIKPIVNMKQFLEQYITDLFSNNKFRDLFVIKNASSTDQVKNFIESLKQGKIYTDRDIVVEGDIEQKQIRDMKDFQWILQLHENYKAMIREFLRVPPLMTGDTGSNKSTGEFEVRYAFDNTVISWQKILADQINNELFPLLGGDWKEVEIRFFPLDKPSEKTSIELAVQLKGLGYTNDTIHKFLLNKGVNLPDDADFEQIDDMGETTTNQSDAESKTKQMLRNRNSVSRAPRVKSVDNKNTNENKETREEQIVGKSDNVDWKKYPTVYEGN